MKKILYVITKSNWGGAQRYVYDLATHGKDQGHEIKVALGGDGTLAKRLQAEDIPILQLPFAQRDINFLKEAFLFFFLIYLFIKERPDVIHVNSSKIGGLGALAARIASLSHKLSAKSYKLKIIFTAHGFAFHEIWRSALSRKVIYFFSWLTVLFSTHTVTLSEKETQQARSMPFIKGTKIHHIYLGVPKIEPLPKEEVLQKLIDEYELKYDPIKPLFGTISELTKNKGLDFLIRACAILRDKKIDFTCVIISHGEDYDELHNLVVREKLTEYVQFLGFVPEASKYLEMFDVFTLSSRKEGLPYTILEAGSVGRAVIASDIGGIPDIIDHEKSGILIPMGNVKALAANLEALLASPGYRQDFGDRLKETINTKFALQTMLEKTYTLYALESHK